METYKILTGTQTTNTYPYGRLRCTRTMKIEFKKSHGYRIQTQTTNPKTGRLNAPKNGTYYNFICLIEEKETGYSKGLHFDLNGDKSVQTFLNFLKIHKDFLTFSTEESQHLLAQIIATLKIGAQWTKFKIPAEGERETILQYLDAIKMPEILKLYKEKADIKEILNLEIDLLETMKQFEDKENGEAVAKLVMVSHHQMV